MVQEKSSQAILRESPALQFRSVVLVFAKPPEPGRVKTRLLSLLTPKKAASLHRACLADTIATMTNVPGCRKWLRVAARPNRAQELGRELQLTRRWHVGIQHGRDLGARLEEAFQSAFCSGFQKVIVVGTDTPWMDSNRVLRALQTLRTADTVIGPTVDGGYYLIGARRFIPAMFWNIPWGTSQVLDRTLAAIRKAHASCRLMRRDFDLDRPADFERAQKMLRENKNRAATLARWMVEWELDEIIESSRRRRRRRPGKRRRPVRV